MKRLKRVIIFARMVRMWLLVEKQHALKLKVTNGCLPTKLAVSNFPVLKLDSKIHISAVVCKFQNGVCPVSRTLRVGCRARRLNASMQLALYCIKAQFSSNDVCHKEPSQQPAHSVSHRLTSDYYTVQMSLSKCSRDFCWQVASMASSAESLMQMQ